MNIRADEIVDGNPKLTLGLIWTLILHYQVSDLIIAILLVISIVHWLQSGALVVCCCTHCVNLIKHYLLDDCVNSWQYE